MINRIRKPLITLLAFFCFGTIMYAWYHGIILIRLRRHQTEQPGFAAQQAAITKHKVKMHYWHQERWMNEQSSIIWYKNKRSDNIAHLIQAWFTLLEEDNIIARRVSVQSCALSGSGKVAYASFDRSPFGEQDAIFAKWLLIEGLLKTLHANQVGITHIHLLCHNQPIKDYHIDFNNPWPVSGFAKH
ncbi:hypothetical protein HOL34_03090 [bacterium]|jgi:hypothetical protein|nr:hypothetical protein [bacterium]MBT3903285.1 hypothetical protein [bacterium]MBT4577484.1 hypothetical protein [bacterium]MBT5345800.1 hypothetical protein [bacterium]MBT6130859.1 hypothetical protein [bacterium]